MADITIEAPSKRGEPELARRALIATVAAIVPGAGHAVLGQLGLGAALLGAFVVGGALAAWHLARGLALFESPLGAFLFGVLLRGLAILVGFSVGDAYLRAVQRLSGEADVLAKRQLIARRLARSAAEEAGKESEG